MIFKWAYYINPKFFMLSFINNNFKKWKLYFRYKAQEYPTYLPFINPEVCFLSEAHKRKTLISY